MVRLVVLVRDDERRQLARIAIAERTTVAEAVRARLLPMPAEEASSADSSAGSLVGGEPLR